MKVLKLDQNTDDWYKWRNEGIGASEISIIMGSNPYKTPLKLWEEKCGYAEPEGLNPAMLHGIRHEPVAREWLNNNFKLNLEPICVEDEEHSFFKASLDGYDFEKQILHEIKCPVSATTLDAAKNEGKIHEYWIDQVYWQFMLSSAKECYISLWDYRESSCITIKIEVDIDRLKLMREKAKEFWEFVQQGIQPELMPIDFIEIEDEKLHEKLLEYTNLCEKKRILEKDIKSLKQNIESYGDDGNFKAYGFKIIRIAPRKKYNLNKMKLDGINIDSYIEKNDSIGWYRIIPPK